MSTLAYIDAGTGSLLIQALAGGFAGAAVITRLYWRKLKRLFTGHRGTEA